jgi:Fic family protein
MYSPTFTITPKVLADISEIAEIKTIVERSKILPEREAVLRRQAVIRIAHTSTSIEGNLLAEYQVEKVLAGEKVPAEENFVKEVKNYEQALTLVDKLAKKKEIEERDIFNLHRLVVKGLVNEQKLGRWRPAEIYIVRAKKDHDELQYTGPKADKIPGLIKELLVWVKGKTEEGLHPILVAALLHFQFVSIHPFTDGNGRLGRLLTQLYLYQRGWDFRKLITLENYYAKDRKGYIGTLRDVGGETFSTVMKADVTRWLEYFTNGFLAEARKVKDMILPIMVSPENDDEVVRLDKDEIKVLDFLATMGQIKSQDVVDLLGIPKRTVQLKLKNLVAKGVMEMRGKGPATYYELKG